MKNLGKPSKDLITFHFAVDMLTSCKNSEMWLVPVLNWPEPTTDKAIIFVLPRPSFRIVVKGGL